MEGGTRVLLRESKNRAWVEEAGRGRRRSLGESTGTNNLISRASARIGMSARSGLSSNGLRTKKQRRQENHGSGGAERSGWSEKRD